MPFQKNPRSLYDCGDFFYCGYRPEGRHLFVFSLVCQSFLSVVHKLRRDLIHGADVQIRLAVAYLVLGEQAVILIPKGVA